MKEMDLFEKCNSCRNSNRHSLILSNFTHNDTAICRSFRQFR
jgi:hypothetical protein